MAVLSVDLAYRRWSDLGIVVLERRSAAVQCEILSTQGLGLDPDHQDGPVDANALAGILNHMAAVRSIQVMMLDGPQAWKARDNGCEHARVSERQLNTAAKTGLPGKVKPFTYRPFAEFCLDVYDALCRRGWRRLATREQPGRELERVPDRVLAESYPHAAWKALGLKPLPSKRLHKVSDLAEAYGALRQLIPLTTDRPPNHDQLQAIVGGVAGLALEARDAAGTQIVGTPPRRVDGHWREGFIVVPLAPAQESGQG